MAGCPVELAKQALAETAGKRRAGRMQNITYALQSDAGKARHEPVFKPQRGKRQRGDGFCFPSVPNNCSGTVTGQCPCGSGGGGDGCACVQSLMEQVGKQVAEQLFLAAEQMGAAGNIEEKAIVAVKRHQWGVSVAPVGDALEKTRIGGRIGGQCFKVRVAGTGFCQTKACAQAKLLCIFVQPGEADGRAVAVGDGNGRMVRTTALAPRAAPALAGDPVCRQMRQRQRQNATGCRFGL